MECNRDEAIRARSIAEKKMQNNDFEGARKIALKAQQLFPELENISQLLSVCDVHCSAQNKVCGSEKDWYGILQVERLADEVTIKKQYRKLALVLHPDKNKCPGAEAAFKLIGEANMVLSDKAKRSLYDIKSRVSVRTAVTKAPPHQVNRNPPVRKQYVAQNNIPNVSDSQFGGLHHGQAKKPDLPNGQQAFWTCCPFCNNKYQYYREYVNRYLHCQNCSKPFITYDLGAQGAPSGSKCGQPAFSQQKQVPNLGAFQMSGLNTGGFPSSNLGNSSSRAVGSESVTRTGTTAKVVEGSKIKGKGDGHAYTEGGKEGVEMPKADVLKPRESRNSRNTQRKRGRQLVVESSESCDTSSSSDRDTVIEENGGNPSTRNSSGLNGTHHPRRSFRQRRYVSYNETASDDDDFVSPPKRSRESTSSSDTKEKQGEESLGNEESEIGDSSGFLAAAAAAAADRDKEEIKCKGSADPEEALLGRNDEAGMHKVNGEEAVTVDNDDKESEVIDDSESNLNADCTSDPEFHECPDPDFNDFDKDREEHCFAVDQIWACYDTIDSMPRFYAHVKKVFSPRFKLRITWLEADPKDQDEIDWVTEGFPVACGKFIGGSSEDTSDRLTFSHQVQCEKGRSRCSYVIYPRKGETWALFKDWDIKWSSDPENHKKYRYEIVEVLSDFVKDVGLEVAYLDKLKGFVSLFQRTTWRGLIPFLIPSGELFKFSHRIPSFKMTGTEIKGIPEGSFELDPASLPANLNEFCYPNEEKMESKSMDAEVNGSCPRSPEKTVKPTMGSEKMHTPTKCVDFKDENNSEREMSRIRRSPRELNKRDKKQKQVNASQCFTQQGVARHLNDTDDKTHGEFTPFKGNVSVCQAYDEINTKETSPTDNFTKSPSIFPSFSAVGKDLEVLYNFSEDRSEGKFQPGQIWAMYTTQDGLPKKYAKVKKIESSPFRVHVALLEAITPPKDVMQPVSCGIFKVQLGKARVLSHHSFSHVLKAKSIGRNIFEIYPREGEIWALYKNWNVGLSWSDRENYEFEIVEVLEDNEHSTKVSSLVRVDGFKSVFKSPRRQISSIGVMEIPRGELARFSHQIPGFRLTSLAGEKDDHLKGYWELDPFIVSR